MIAVGFRVLVRDHHIKVEPFAHDPALLDRYLSWYHDGMLTCILIGRLYYRAERLLWLAKRIDEKELQCCRDNDAALAALHYREGGIDTLADLEGDVTLVGLDHRRNRLFAYRDRQGAYPLFWSATGRRIVISTSIRPIADTCEHLEVDPDYIAEYIASNADAMAELPIAHSAYKGIQRLLPAHVLTYSLDTGSVSCRALPVQERHPVPVIVSLEQAGAEVRACLEAAVAERLSPIGRTACHFSGGFDSTGVTLLAERLSRLRGGHVEALTLVYAGERSLHQEERYVAAALKCAPAIHHRTVAADDLVEFDDYEQGPLLDEPSPMSANYKVMSALIAAAVEASCDTILTGRGADHLFDYRPSTLIASLIRRGHFNRALAVAQKKGSGRVVRASMANLLAYMPGERSFRGVGAGLPLASANPPWLVPAYIQRYHLDERRTRYRALKQQGDLLTVRDSSFLAGDWFHWYLAVPQGIDEMHPYADRRLLDLVRRIPPEFHCEGTYLKPVLGAALAPILPSVIRTRRRKANLNVLLSGYAKHEAWLVTFLNRAFIDAEIVNRDILIEHVRKAALGLFVDAPAANRLTAAITLLYWMENRNRWLAQTVPYQQEIRIGWRDDEQI